MRPADRKLLRNDVINSDIAHCRCESETRNMADKISWIPLESNPDVSVKGQL